MTSGVVQFLPKAREEGLVVQELADEVLVYDQESFKAHCLNRTAALVWKHCNGERTVTDVARVLGKELNSPVEDELVWLAVDQLGRSRLLTERITKTGSNEISRRELIKRVGIAAAVALPAVTSIVAPKAAQAANCLPSGAGCTTGAECCSGVCSSNTCT